MKNRKKLSLLCSGILNFILFSCFFGGACLPACAQWKELPFHPDGFINRIDFPDQNRGILSVGSALFKTNDTGETWDTLFSDSNAYIYDFHFITPDTGFMVIHSNTASVIKFKITHNGGLSWAEGGNLAADVSKIYFINSQTGFAASSNFSIYRTSDGGATWNTNHTHYSAVPGDFAFQTDSQGFFAGWYAGSLFKTNTAGDSWQNVNNGYELTDIHFSGKDTGIGVGWYGTIIKTTDGGTTWSALTSGTTTKLNTAFCVNNNTFYIAGDTGSILKTTDGGLNWEQQYSGTSQHLNIIYCIDQVTCLIGGDNGIILKTTNGGTVITPQDKKKNDIRVYHDPFQTAITVDLGDLRPGSCDKWVLQVCDRTGKAVLNEPLSNKTPIQLFYTDKLNEGAYFYRITGDGQLISNGKLLIQP